MLAGSLALYLLATRTRYLIKKTKNKQTQTEGTVYIDNYTQTAESDTGDSMSLEELDIDFDFFTPPFRPIHCPPIHRQG